MLYEKENRTLEGAWWLFTEAVDGRYMQECGTFRRALSYRVERELISVLSVVLARIDCHQNMDLLIENKWKQQLWIELFQCPEILLINYDDVKESVSGRTIHKQSQFVCWFPFSTSLVRNIQDQFSTHFEEG